MQEEESSEELSDIEEGAGKEDKGNMYPNIVLEREELRALSNVSAYTEVLYKQFGGEDRPQGIANMLIALHPKNPELQFATIFCFEAIGVCVISAKAYFIARKIDPPLFWKNLSYFKNSLVHHFLDFTLPSDCLEVLAKVAINYGQVFNYFKTIRQNKNTNISAKQLSDKHRYKVFLDIFELTDMLRTKYSRAIRKAKDQNEYLKLIRKLIAFTVFLVKDIPDLTEESIIQLKKDNPTRFYALQGCLERIAVLTTPNEKYSVLTEESYKKIINIHPNARKCFSLLGISRNQAMHDMFGVMDEASIVEHLNGLRPINLILSRNVQAQQKAASVVSVSTPVKIAKGLAVTAPMVSSAPLNQPPKKENTHQTAPNPNLFKSITGEYFERMPVLGDGDCGYTAFGITREQAYQLISGNLNDVRDVLIKLAQEVLCTDENFIQYLPEDFRAAREDYRFYCDALQRKDPALEGYERSLKQHGNDLNLLLCYLDYDIKDKRVDAGWAHPLILFALAHIQRVPLRLWELNEEGELIPHRHYPECHPQEVDGEPTDLLFISGNHFERLQKVTLAQFNEHSPKKIPSKKSVTIPPATGGAVSSSKVPGSIGSQSQKAASKKGLGKK